ncbi:MAG: hypothetical protein ACK4M1_10335 [Flavobacterium sp.]|uniref:hypothetical protein n=1 Tax=Flavobacterium sp. TaxID=239 RepID=UPI0025C55E9B|nr:hypothetical protein [Flavobacterium sp.]MCA1967393.1 hypothetical protein [Flavobacterium sp.]
MKNIEIIISFLKEPDTYWSSKGNLVIENDFEIKPQDFLNYAEIDLQNTYSHNLINTLSNAKRALDCQVDILLMAFGYYNISKKKFWGFPKKIEIIKELGILAPRVLLKVNKTRNLMEHQYVKPTLEQVEDFVDIVALFIASTDKYIYNFPNDLQIENDSLENFWIDFSNNYKEENLTITVIHKDSENEELTINYKDSGYSELLSLILKIGNKN